MITLLNIKFIVTDDNENNYVPVYSIKDIGAEHKTYILMNDIVISEENERSYIHYIFNGVLINPYGHKITIAETSNILILFYVNRGIIDGIKMNGKIYNSISSMPGIVMGFGNQGLIRNCDINLDIEAEYISMYLKNVYNTKIAGNYKILHSEIANEPKGFIISEINSSKHNNIDITVEGPLEYIILPDNEMIGDNMINVSVRSSGEED